MRCARFASGLLANIGSLGLAAARPDDYAGVLSSVANDDRGGEKLRDAEKAAFGYTHLDLAAAMMQDWSIPRLFCEAVLHHKAPSQSGLDEESRHLRLAQMLHVAGIIADYCVAPEGARVQALQALLDAGAPLNGEVDHVIALCDRVGRDWMEWSSMVNISAQALPPTRDVLAQLREQSGQ